MLKEPTRQHLFIPIQPSDQEIKVKNAELKTFGMKETKECIQNNPHSDITPDWDSKKNLNFMK